MTILFADLHAYLDNMKSSWDLLKYRTEYYIRVIKGMLRSLGIPLDKLKFVTGSDYELSADYTLDMYRLSSLVTEHDAIKAGAEVVKQVANPKISGILYPELQALDEEYLHVDAQFGGTDQRKIFMFAKKYLPKIGYASRIHLMNFMVPGLVGEKMSSSEENSKIDLIDDPKTVIRKIRTAFCEPGNVEKNGVLSFAKMVLFHIVELPFVVDRPEKYGGKQVFQTPEEMEQAFAAQELSPQDLKEAVAKYLNLLLDPIRASFDNQESRDLVFKAYQTKLKPLQAEEAAPALPAVCRLGFKVGEITKIWEMEGKDSLYCEEIDVGEEKPRTVLSGLRKFFAKEDLLHRRVVLVSNLKPWRVGTFVSQGMVLCAENEDASAVELVEPPAGAQIGELVQFEGLPPVKPDEEVNPNRKTSPWGKCVEFFRADKEGVAVFKENAMTTSAGKCTVKTLRDVKLC